MLSDRELAVADEKADTCIATMVGGIVAGALVPAHVNWAVTASAMGAGCVAIGNCYGFTLDKGEGWALCREFFKGAGFLFLGFTVGSKIFAAIMETTGLGYGAGVALDGVTSAAIAYAIGGASKDYFRQRAQGGNVNARNFGKHLKKYFEDYKRKNS